MGAVTWHHWRGNVALPLCCALACRPLSVTVALRRLLVLCPKLCVTCSDITCSDVTCSGVTCLSSVPRPPAVRSTSSPSSTPSGRSQRRCRHSSVFTSTTCTTFSPSPSPFASAFAFASPPSSGVIASPAFSRSSAGNTWLRSDTCTHNEEVRSRAVVDVVGEEEEDKRGGNLRSNALVVTCQSGKKGHVEW